MRLTTKGRYAVTAMLDLALRQDQGPISLSDISGRQGISLSYLEQLFSKLRKKNLVSSVRGPGGGYRLSRDAHKLYVAEIIDAVDEKVNVTVCNKDDEHGCQEDGSICLTHHLWTELSDQIHDFLSGISLGSLVERSEIKAVSERQSIAELEKKQTDSNVLASSI